MIAGASVSSDRIIVIKIETHILMKGHTFFITEILFIIAGRIPIKYDHIKG